VNPSDAEWGARGALNYLATHRDRSANQLVEGLYEEARGFAFNGLQQDDITSVVVKVEAG